MEQCVDVTCPPGAIPGATIQVDFNGQCFDVTVPEGISEGVQFQVMVTPSPAIDDVLAALNVVLDALEDHDDDVLDNIVDRHCAEFAQWEKGGEQDLGHHELFLRYVAECEGFIGEVLGSINSSAEDVFAQAQAYSGSDERVQKLITRLLATDDFETFCHMMRDRHEILQIFNADEHAPRPDSI